MQTISLLGATGSIGQSTLSVIASHPDKFSVTAVSANTDVLALFKLCQRWKPRYAVMAQLKAAEALALKVKEAKLPTEVLTGEEGLIQIAEDPEVQTVVSAIVGAAGLLPTLAALKAGKRVLLANKESLVKAGSLMIKALEEGGGSIIPVDSEHNALFQAMPAEYQCGQTPSGVKQLILTASGGPFRDLPLEKMNGVTVDQAISHPNWSMGPKISVDSATMMNKGLEVIEAYWLFKMPSSKIRVLIHPQSIVHSLVEYSDGSQLAQLGLPDMRTPIACALSWPERISSGVGSLNLATQGTLNFMEPDLERFPCLALAFRALEQGGAAPAILNAANEVAVEAFLAGKIPFLTIPKLINEALNALPLNAPIDTISALIAIDHQTRFFVGTLLPKAEAPV